MPTVDEAVENITWAAGDSFLSNYLDEVLDEVFERAEEDCVEPDEVLDEVVAEWLDRSYIYDEVYDYLYEHIDNECMYTDDCMEIIADYGFSDSLAAAVDVGCDLSDVTESAVASAVLTLNMPDDDTMQDEIRNAVPIWNGLQNMKTGTGILRTKRSVRRMRWGIMQRMVMPDGEETCSPHSS